VRGTSRAASHHGSPLNVRCTEFADHLLLDLAIMKILLLIIVSLVAVWPSSSASADEKQAQVDAGRIPRSQWQSGFVIQANILPVGKKSDVVLTPVPRRSAIYDKVVVATLAREQPIPRLCAIVPYPAELAKAGISGAALVAFVVSGSGQISDIRLIEASDQRFGESAMTMVSKWKYKGLGHDKGTRFLCLLPVWFRVEAQ